MNFKTTILLFFLVAIGGGVFWYVQIQDAGRKPGEDTPPAPKRERLIADGPEDKDVVRIVVEAAPNPRTVLEREPRADDPNRLGDWRLVEPLPSETEQALVNRLVRTYTLVESKDQYTPAELSAQDAGLDPPAARVTLVGRGDKQAVVEIGRKAAIGGDVYVRVAGRDTIHVVGENALKEAREDPARYRSKALARFQLKDAVQLDITHGGKDYRFVRGDNNQWRIEAPVLSPAADDKVKTLLGDLLALRIVDFLREQPGEPAVYGFDAPFARVQVTTETRNAKPVDPSASQPAVPEIDVKRETFELLVGNAADIEAKSRFVQIIGQNWVGTVSDTAAQKLAPKLAELRDPRITRIKEADVTRLELTAAGQTATLERTEGRWTGAGDLDQLETAALTDILQAVEDLRATEFKDDPQPDPNFGLDNPRAVLKLTAAGTPGVVTLKIGAASPSGQNAFVQLEGSPSVMVVSERQAQRLAVAPIALRSRQIFDFPPTAIRRIDVTRGKRETRLTRDGAAWKLEVPAGAPVDPAGSREIANDLARMRARRVVARSEQAAEYGLASPELSIRFLVEQPADGPPASAPASAPSSAPAAIQTEYTLRVGRVRNVAYAARDGDPFIYELDETVYASLGQELILRQVLDLDPQSITNLRIEATGGTLEFTRENGQWVYSVDPTVQLTQKTVDELVAELAKLRIERYLVYEDADIEAAGFNQAPATVTMRQADGSSVTLKLDQAIRGEVPRLAAWVEQKRVFLMRPGEANRLMRGLDEYLKRETPPQPAPQPPPAPGRR